MRPIRASREVYLMKAKAYLPSVAESPIRAGSQGENGWWPQTPPRTQDV